MVFTDWLSMIAALGVAVSSLSLPNPGAQGLLNALPGPVPAPLPKIPPHRAPGWQVMGHHAPGYATAQHIQDAIYYFPKVHGPGVPLGLLGGSKGDNSADWRRSNRWDKVFFSYSQHIQIPDPLPKKDLREFSLFSHTLLEHYGPPQRHTEVVAYSAGIPPDRKAGAWKRS